MVKRSLMVAVAVAAGAAAVAIADVAPAARNTKPAAGAAASAATADSGFMMKAAGDGMAEVELGRLAIERASGADVKAFAQMMVDDHSKANGELTGLAGQKGVTLPAGPPPPARAVADRLRALSGAGFDKAYMAQMVKDHEKAVALFSKEASGGRDAETKEWAAKTLPTLQQHLTRAREVAGGKATAGAHSH
jgi:putative membrane protein